eukprot:TRINITY_DN2513_c0_g1_i1.p1 TRINITY_DN2513_c0_g1~~TRINITY_DN2513_c0_g1_i1.p1  ORF type:complete len:471 (-),score=91.31 TRINITY_DN2513_c0_g1_i1:1066-2478(-)
MREEYEEMLKQKRLDAEQKKRERREVKLAQSSERRLQREEQRKERGRDSYLKTISTSSPIEDTMRDISVSPVKYGMDAEHAIKMEEKYDYELEERIMDWIEDVTGFAMNSFYDDLCNGQVLCHLINSIKPNMIPLVHTRDQALLERENIKFFVNACRGLGVNQGDLFEVNDLYDRHNIGQVLNCLYALTQVLEMSSWYAGPRLNGRKAGGDGPPRFSCNHLPYFLKDQPVPRGCSAILFLAAFLTLAFFAGFGNSVGFYTFWRPMLFDCPSTLHPNTPLSPVFSNDTNGTAPHTIDPLCVDTSVATISGGVGLWFLGAGGLMLELAGPKITMMIGLVFKVVGCFLLADLRELKFLSVTVALSFLDAGGSLILLSLTPAFLLFPRRPAGIFFGLIGTYCFGSGLLALLGYFLGSTTGAAGIHETQFFLANYGGASELLPRAWGSFFGGVDSRVVFCAFEEMDDIGRRKERS